MCVCVCVFINMDKNEKKEEYYFYAVLRHGYATTAGHFTSLFVYHINFVKTIQKYLKLPLHKNVLKIHHFFLKLNVRNHLMSQRVK